MSYSTTQGACLQLVSSARPLERNTQPHNLMTCVCPPKRIGLALEHIRLLEAFQGKLCPAVVGSGP